MCIIGASMGGAIVLMFSLKYPSYVNMICLLAPPGITIINKFVFSHIFFNFFLN